jgi:hypothetical protein
MAPLTRKEYSLQLGYCRFNRRHGNFLCTVNSQEPVNVWTCEILSLSRLHAVKFVFATCPVTRHSSNSHACNGSSSFREARNMFSIRSSTCLNPVPARSRSCSIGTPVSKIPVHFQPRQEALQVRFQVHNAWKGHYLFRLRIALPQSRRCFIISNGT